MTLRAPTDVDAAYAAWGADCGPCALAALLGCEVGMVRMMLDEGFPKRRYMNPTHMLEALRRSGVNSTSTGPEAPKRGLAFIQWEGPWTAPGTKIAWAYRHTHWIAVEGDMVYDVNADAWVTFDLWKKVMPELIRQEVKGATGGWFVRRGFEVPSRPSEPNVT